MFKVYWMDLDGIPMDRDFDDMKDALDWTQTMRDAGRSFVTMVSENPNSVGKPGVDSVVNGVLPDGSEYSWKKRR